MQPSSPHHRSLFSVLPPEIIVQILSYTDACTIGRVSASSSCCKAVIDENSQIIYEALAIRHLNATTPCTAGDSGITINSLPAFALEELELDQHSAIAPVARQLQRAIKYQRTSSTAYDNITTWRDFVKKRTLVNKAWKHGRLSRYTAASCPTFGGRKTGLWRFKICSYSRFVFASTPVIPVGDHNTGVLFGIQRAPEPQQLYELLEQTRGWTHVEYSNGYLIYIDRHTIEVNALDSNAVYPETCKLTHKHSIVPPTPLMSYKARYPYLHALSRTEGKTYLFDLEAGRLVREFNLMTDPEPFYVELDQWSLFLAGSTLSVIDRKNASRHDLITPDFDGQHDIWSTRFTAVHHSLDSRHLLAAGDANELVWIRDYRDILEATGPGVDQEVLARNAVILRLESDAGEVMVENLCVENDRVVFTTQSTCFPVVYLFELHDWTDFSDFKAHPPLLRILSGGFPTGTDGIGRVEMDSTCVYLTGSTRQEFADTPGFEDVHPADLELAWFKLDGTRLCNAHVRPTWPPSSPAQKHDMRDFNTQHRIFLNDAVLCYDFSMCHENNQSSEEEEDQSESMFTSQHSQEGSNEEWEDAETSSDPEEHEEADEFEI